MPTGKQSASGVFISDDFRSNLIIDRYDAEFLKMRRLKTVSMRSENSEDVLTWNVFRSLAQIDPGFWFPRLFKQAFRNNAPTADGLGVRLWRRVEPPPNVAIPQGKSEVDVSLETQAFVWFIEAKYRSDVAAGTKHDPTHDQVLRNIDVGSWYAGVRDFYFSLLILDDKSTAQGAAIVSGYADSLDKVAQRLPTPTN